MPEYYTIDSRKVSFLEYWNLDRSWKVVFVWIAKVLGIRLRLTSGIRRFDSVRELEVTEGDFPASAWERLQPLLEACLPLGFHSPRFFCFDTLARESRSASISMLHPSGEFSIRLMHRAALNTQPNEEHRLVVLFSELTDGTLVFTSDERPRLRSPPGVIDNRLVGAHPSQLLESHQRLLAGPLAGNPPEPFRSHTDIDAAWDRFERLSFDFELQRGFLRPMTSAEVDATLARLERTQTLEAAGSEHAGVLAELDRLAHEQPRWGSASLVFVVSLALFIVAGSQLWSWSLALLLVPILFVHELGHYLTMRLFKYRNLRMFFIPFLGAAVIGRPYNVAGWKKVVVSLMGPLPGIVLAAIAVATGVAYDHPLAHRAANLALLVNSFNLLPILPLDGGWICHTLLFARHPILDMAFRVLAVVGLFTAGLVTRTRIFFVLGFFMALAIPNALRLARIASDLRRRNLPAAPADDQTIPHETAAVIAGELKRVLPRPFTDRIVATKIREIFETLNSKPPGWLASLGLLLLYLAALAIAAVAVGFLIGGAHSYPI